MATLTRYGPPTRMPGIVNLPSARVTAAYAVPDGPCSATTRAPSSGTPDESVTTPATAAVVTPCAAAGRTAPRTTTARSKPADQMYRFIEESPEIVQLRRECAKGGVNVFRAAGAVKEPQAADAPSTARRRTRESLRESA